MAKEKITQENIAKTQELRCFIIMPFSEAKFEDKDGNEKVLNENKLRHIYQKLIRAAVKTYARNNVKFAQIHRYEKTRGNFVKGIINDLDKADLVIGDLTGLNSNVFYELGIRHTLKIGTIMLTQNAASLPADLKNYIAFEYEYPEQSDAFAEYYPKFKKKLHKAIDEFLKDQKTGEFDNPVRDFIGNRIIFQNEQRIKEIKGNIKLMRFILDEYISNVKAQGKTIEKWADGKIANYVQPSNSISSFLNRLIMLNEDINLIRFIRNIDTSLNLIEKNKKFVHNNVVEKKDVNACREIHYGFVDINGEMHHIVDLYNSYKNPENIQKCPMFKSFQKFIDDWESELEKLTAGK